MPRGKMILSVGSCILMPKAPNTETALLTKKLKYLKNPNIPRLEKILRYKKYFFLEGLSRLASIPKDA